MTPPKHFADDDLKAYIDSVPPPTEIEFLRSKIESRLETTTGIHELKELEKAQQALVIKLAEDKIKVEHEARLDAQNKLSAIYKWIAITISGVVVIVVAAGILWMFSQLNKVH